jgi:hypothetical protein
MYKEAAVFQQKENEKQFLLENKQEEKQDFFYFVSFILLTS